MTSRFVSNSFTISNTANHTNIVTQWLEQTLFRNTRVRRTVKTAYAQFVQNNPDCQDALFDDHFVKCHLIPMFLEANQRNQTANVNDVVLAWKRQFGLNPDKLQGHHTQAMVAKVSTFVTDLKVALS